MAKVLVDRGLRDLRFVREHCNNYEAFLEQVQDYDLLKLFGKEDLESGDAPVMQRAAAGMGFAVPLVLAGLLPLGYAAPLGGYADVIVLVYVLALASIATLLAGLAAGSTFSLMGVSREMMLVITLEPLLVVALIVGAVHANSLRIGAVLNGSVYAAGVFPVSGLVMLGVMLLSLQAFLKRVPFDIAEAETEIMEGPLVEYSGPKLALFKHGQMAKLILYSAILINLFVPWDGGLPLLLSLPLFWCKVALLVLLTTWIAATHARYRIDQALRRFVLLLGVSLGALVLATFGL